MMRNLVLVGSVAAVVAGLGVAILTRGWPIGPLLLALGAIPVGALLLARRSLRGATPDLVFGGIDTGLLVVPAVWGGAMFGVAGAIAGGIIGDALTDAIAGFFEGGIAQTLRRRGIESAREPVTTALGKMAGCLLGAGAVLTLLALAGIEPSAY